MENVELNKFATYVLSHLMRGAIKGYGTRMDEWVEWGFTEEEAKMGTWQLWKLAGKPYEWGLLAGWGMGFDGKGEPDANPTL